MDFAFAGFPAGVDAVEHLIDLAREEEVRNSRKKNIL
jgi:hypothetical protein